MSEDKKALIDLIPESVDNAVKNITDKPTQNIGTTLADIWYLVFGGISQAAEKRKLKYSYALQEFEKELKEKIAKIPENDKIQPDIQTVATALEASKYCIENAELRNMFSNLITSTMDINISDLSQPIFVDILKNLKPLDCKILKAIYENSEITVYFKSNGKFDFMIPIFISLDKLNSYGLIQLETMMNSMKDDFFQKTNLNVNNYLKYIKDNLINDYSKFLNFDIFEYSMIHQLENYDCMLNFKLKPIIITPLGVAFKIICVE